MAGKKKETEIVSTPSPLTGTATLNTDLSVNLTLTDLLEIIVDEENQIREELIKSCSQIDIPACNEKFDKEFHDYFKAVFAEDIELLEPILGKLVKVSPHCIKSVNIQFKNGSFWSDKYCYDYPNNQYNVQRELEKFALSPWEKSIIKMVSVKEVRIKVNKELLSRKTMSNQEIYTTVKELITLPKETLDGVNKAKSDFNDFYTFNSKYVKLNSKHTTKKK